jgi:hypothetical protein
MDRVQPLQVRPWLWPLVILVIVVPPVAGFATGQPPVGLALGAAVVAMLLVAAARARFDEPIEVGRSPADRFTLLIVAIAAVEDPATAEGLAQIVRAGVGESERGSEILVLAPAFNTKVAHWLNDLKEARFEAQRRLALSVGTLSVAGLETRGKVGDSDVVQAVEDVLRTFPAAEVAFVTPPGQEREAIGDVRRRLDRPVQVLEPLETSSSRLA